jgi:6-phosphogluconate dehydrogenase
MKKSNMGVYGLGVMGRNLALNFNDHEFLVSAYNREMSGEENLVDQFLNGPADGTDIRGFKDVKAFVESLERPRKILLMVKAGPPVDSVIEQLVPLLDEGDILIDGGNTHYSDTNRRLKMTASQGIRYIGMGVSGGEKGARYGPSMMPGGDASAWSEVQPMLKATAASANGRSCCSWMGDEGAGHFVKMVHNGIEYAIMQLLAECYQLMSDGLGLENQEIAHTFDAWNEGLLESYLVEITAKIFTVRDKGQQLVLDSILDKAGQKGTGRWTALTALELGIPLPMITEAVYARTISSFKDLREEASKSVKVEAPAKDPKITVEQLQQALLGGTVVAFAEGFWLLKAANEEFGWHIPHQEVAKTWRGGCIIRSALLEPIAQAFENDEQLPHLLMAPTFKELITNGHKDWRSAVTFAVESGIPVPAMTAALSHVDNLRKERLPANLIQAQRDFFGAHQYERTDQPRGKMFHTQWEEGK